jgi:flagellin
MGATIALQSLNATSSALEATQKEISTGYRVSDATDDGAAYAVAQRVRSDVGALTSANEQLGNVKGLLSTTLSALNNISNTMNSAHDVLEKLTDSSQTGTQRQQYVDQYNSLVSNIKSFFQDAAYNGKTLIGNITGSTGTMGSVGVVRNEVGSTYSIASFSGSAFYGSIAFTSTQLGAATTVSNLLSTTATSGAFINMLNKVGDELNSYGSASNYVDNQISYNSDKIDALNTGLGALIDADLAKESAQLQSLQIRQQLGTQALSIANQAPQTLLSLFK